MKKAILAVSFGTSYESALEKSISAVEKSFYNEFPEYDIYRAFTSGMIIKILRKRGIETYNVDEALKKIYNNHYESVIIQPTHLISGEEYEKLCNCALNYKNKFKEFKIGIPLLNSDDDMKMVCRFFHDRYCHDGSFLILMGHGTEHRSNCVYSEMNGICKEYGFEDMFIGTVESSPSIDDVLKLVEEKKFRKIILTPLMLVAGDHAQNDMAGNEPYSWKSRLESTGAEVEAVVKGMGEYEEIRLIYIDHLRKTIENTHN